MPGINEENLISKAVETCGLGAIAVACDVSYQAVQRWRTGGLPHTDHSGETFHAKNIEKATGEAVKAVDLLEWSKKFRQKRKH